MRGSRLVPAALFGVATVAFPCGGPFSNNVDGPLQTSSGFAERALHPLEDFESLTRDEIRFLPGLLRSDSARFAPLIGRPSMQAAWWDKESNVAVSEPGVTELEAAWRRGDMAAAQRAADGVVARVMALPASNDSARNDALRLAVETIELAPAMSGEPATARLAAFERLASPMRGVSFDSLAAMLSRSPASPRRASMAFAALRVAMRDGIPDGPRDEIAKKVPPVRWDSLQAMHRAWLSKYPAHPYAGLVKFAQLRLFFLASEADSAWSTALALYPAYPARAAVEMRYLLLTGALPSASILTDARVPAEVRVSLVGNLSPSSQAWESLMRLASDPRLARLRENLEERLMAARATDSLPGTALPAGFPAWRANAAALWRYLWAVNMLQVGRVNDAVAFTAAPVTVAEDSALAGDAAMLATRLHIARGDWNAALRVPLLDEWTRRYLLRVLAPDSVARQLLTAKRRDVVLDARLVLATRAAQGGQWSAAAEQVRPVDPQRAARYARMAVLVRDTTSDAGLLRFARAMAAANGEIFYEATRYFYRGMMNRESDLAPDQTRAWDLPWSRAEERQRMYAYLRSGSERYVALRAYASYLGRPGVTAVQRRAAVREADRVYRGLLATDPSRSDSGYWADSLPVSAEARAIRAAGRR